MLAKLKMKYWGKTNFWDDYNAQLKRNLEKLKDEDENFNQCAFELVAIKEGLESHSNERMSDPEGTFIPNESLRQTLKKEQLGITQLFNQKLYDIVSDLNDNEDAMSKQMEQIPLVANEMCCASDQVMDSTPQNSASEQAYQTTEVEKRPKENKNFFGKFMRRGRKSTS